MNYQEAIRDLQKRNHELRTRVVKLEASRDVWRMKAKLYRKRHEEVLHKRRQRQPHRRTFSVEEWRQHALIVARIRAIPNRPSGWEELVGVELEDGVTLVRDNDILTE